MTNLIAILDGKEVKRVTDFMEWARLFNQSDWQVALDHVNGIKISTVFLGIDHGYGGKPHWFETMIFGGGHDGYLERYATWDEAEVGHQKALEMVIGGS